MEVPKVIISEEEKNLQKASDANLKRRRKKTNYKKINNQTRQKLIEMVYLNDYLLKDAAKILNINYSTAKTILRIFRIEKRIEKKNADEERELKQVIYKFKKDKTDITNQVFTNSNPYQPNKTDVLSGESSENLPRNSSSLKIKVPINQDSLTDTEQDQNTTNSYTRKETSKVSSSNNIDISNLNMKDLSCSNSDEFQVKFDFLHCKIKECQSDLKSCFDQIKSNESMMNYLMIQFQRLGDNFPSILSNGYNGDNFNNTNFMALGNCNYPHQSSFGISTNPNQQGNNYCQFGYTNNNNYSNNYSNISYSNNNYSNNSYVNPYSYQSSYSNTITGIANNNQNLG